MALFYHMFPGLNTYGTDWGDQGLTWISEEYLDVHADVILWLRNQKPT